MPNAYGRRPRTTDTRDFLAQLAPVYAGAYVNLEPGMPPIWDQGDLGSCVSHGTCAAMIYALLHAGGLVVDPSRLFHYYAARLRAGLDVTADTGMEVRDGLASAADDGMPPSADWPYAVDQFAVRPPDHAWDAAEDMEAGIYGVVPVNGIDDCIAGGHPVVIGFDVYSSFESDTTARTGVMAVPDTGREEPVGGHCVVLVSTPKDGGTIDGGVKGLMYRRARNSWGTGWGDRGYFWFPLAAMNHASDFWQITSINSTRPPEPPPGPVVDSQTRAFAAALHKNGWVTGRHVGENARIAHAAQQWLAAEGL